MTGLGAGVPCAAYGCGHGTSVAGIALGRAEDESHVGIAPRADLISINRETAFKHPAFAAPSSALRSCPQSRTSRLLGRARSL
ncbi:MAG: S8 family serine peptidase [bacterium]